MSEPKLLRCPFCGDDSAEVAKSAQVNIRNEQQFGVYCNGCFCEGPTHDTAVEAISAWNTRAKPEHGEG